MNLYNKFRPKDFESIIGNEDAIKALIPLPSREIHPHVFLLTGPRGTGKTTLARILAVAFGAGPLSIKEINSSNNRGIDTAREIQDQLRFAPDDGVATAWIIDEVHKTTNEWQNAMLKALEEPPEHVYFFLCTTDPQKLLAAIKSRCTPVVLNSLTYDEVLFLLRKVNREEGLKLDIKTLEAIADRAAGIPREALVLLESAAAVEDPEVRMRLITTALPEDEQAETIELCRALLNPKSSWGGVCDILGRLNVDDPEKIRHAVMGYMQAVLLKGNQNDRAAWVLECFSEPFYNTGKPGLTLACYQSVFAS